MKSIKLADFGKAQIQECKSYQSNSELEYIINFTKLRQLNNSSNNCKINMKHSINSNSSYHKVDSEIV